MAEFPVLFEKQVTIRRYLPDSTTKTETAGSGITICRAVGLKGYKGEPVEGYRVQLGRPGRAFIFLADEEFAALAEGMAQVTAGV